MVKIAKEKFKTYGNVFDNFTIRKLFNLSAKGLFDEPLSPLSIGKEANVFTAEKDSGKIIIKIYRLEACDFNRMYDYIKYDPRYINLKSKRREIIFNWSGREFRNIMKARELGVRVPLPIYCSDHIIIMESIGNNTPAPKLKDHYPKDPKKFMDIVIKYMRKLWKGNLIHGDLSEFNILNHNDKPVFIDFSQGTVTTSPNAMELLERDCKNIVRFAKKLGLRLDLKELINEITRM